MTGDLTENPPGGDGGGSLERRAVRGFAWASVASWGSKLIILVMTLVLARLLTPKDFGVVAAALSVITYLEIGLDLGVGSAVIYEQEDGVSHRVRAAFTLNVAVAVVLALGFLVASPALASLFDVSSDVWVFRALALYVVVRGIGQVNAAVLQRDLAFREITNVQIIRSGTRAVLTVVLAALGLGPWALVIGLVAGEGAATVRLLAVVRIPPILRTERGVVPALLRYGLGILGLDMVAQVATNADYLVVGAVLGPVDLGYYFMGYRLPETGINTTLGIFSQVAFPTFSKARSAGTADLRHAMLRSLTLSSLFAVSLATGMAIASRDLVRLVLGATWDHAAAPMSVIAIALGIASVGYGSGDLLKAMGRLRALAGILLTAAVVSITGFVLLADRGLVAIAAVHLASALVSATLYAALSMRLVQANGRQVLGALWPAVATSLGIVACALPIRLLMPVGAWTLLALLVAIAVGGVLGLWVGGRRMFAELRGLAGHLFG